MATRYRVAAESEEREGSIRAFAHPHIRTFANSPACHCEDAPRPVGATGSVAPGAARFGTAVARHRFGTKAAPRCRTPKPRSGRRTGVRRQRVVRRRPPQARPCWGLRWLDTALEPKRRPVAALQNSSAHSRIRAFARPSTIPKRHPGAALQKIGGCGGSTPLWNQSGAQAPHSKIHPPIRESAHSLAHPPSQNGTQVPHSKKLGAAVARHRFGTKAAPRRRTPKFIRPFANPRIRSPIHHPKTAPSQVPHSKKLEAAVARRRFGAKTAPRRRAHYPSRLGVHDIGVSARFA